MNAQLAKENDGEITITPKGNLFPKNKRGLQNIGDDSSR